MTCQSGLSDLTTFDPFSHSVSSITDQRLSTKSKRKEPTTLSTLTDDLVPLVVESIRDWAEKVEDVKEWKKVSEEGKR